MATQSSVDNITNSVGDLSLGSRAAQGASGDESPRPESSQQTYQGLEEESPKDGLNANSVSRSPRQSHKFSEIQLVAQKAQPPTKSNSSTTQQENTFKRSDPFQFGSRYLSSEDDVFAWNAWDHVDPSQDSEFVSYAAQQYTFQRENAASDWDRKRFNAEPEKWWDKFYGNNAANFFKDRKWLRQEFPVLGMATGISHEELIKEMAEEAGIEVKDVSAPAPTQDLTGPWNTVLEIGAGAGNTAFPLIKYNRNPNLMVHAVDFSKKAVAVMRNSELYNPKHMRASQWDMASEQLPEGVTPGSVDVVVLVFAFSALSPKQWEQTLRNVWTVLRPGGELCFRDYGRGDLAQVRFKKGRWLGENFYVRGDGTRVYFFEEDELRRIWGGQLNGAVEDALAGEMAKEDSGVKTEEATKAIPLSGVDNMAFEILQLGTDRRLLVNRQKQLKMYRCWMQARFRKPLDPS